MNNDEKVISDQSFNKLEKTLFTEGYREGLSSGREVTFQQGFDTGYSEGFQAGYVLGLHNGVLRFLKSEASPLESSVKDRLRGVAEVEKTSRGLCVICPQEGSDSKRNQSSENSETNQMTEVKLKQKKVICEKMNTLFSEDFSSVLNSVGLDNLLINYN